MRVCACTDYLQDKEDHKAVRLAEAKESNALQECSCCFDDEVLLEDMLQCPRDHMFCRECVRRSSETLIGKYY